MKPIFVLYPSELHLLKVSKYQKIIFFSSNTPKNIRQFYIFPPLQCIASKNWLNQKIEPLLEAMEEKCEYLVVFESTVKLGNKKLFGQP